MPEFWTTSTDDGLTGYCAVLQKQDADFSVCRSAAEAGAVIQTWNGGVDHVQLAVGASCNNVNQYLIARAIVSFGYLTSIPATATILSAIFSIYGYNSGYDSSVPIALFQCATPSRSPGVADYNNFLGLLAQNDTWLTNGLNNFFLGPDGLSYIQGAVIARSYFVHFMLRDVNHDVNGVVPPADHYNYSGIRCFELAFRAQLNVFYSVPERKETQQILVV